MWSDDLREAGFADPFSVGMLINPVVTALLLPSLLVITHGNRLDRLIGDLTYPLYLVHGFVVEAAQYRFGTGVSVTTWTFLACMALAAILLAVDVTVFDPRRKAWQITLTTRLERLRNMTTRPALGA